MEEIRFTYKELIAEELEEDIPTDPNDLVCGLLYIIDLLQHATGKNITKLRNRMFTFKEELQKREHFDVKKGVYYE